MDAALDLVSFLARSENRVTVLLAVARNPASRRALQAETGVPRATLSRILADFRERELVTRNGHEYAATSLGRHLAAELRAVLDSIEAGQNLQALDPWLPLSALDFEARDLRDARVTLPTPVDPLAPVRRTAEVLGASDRVRGLCDNVVPGVLEALERSVVEDGLRADVTVTDVAFEAVSADPALREVVGDLLDTGRLDLRVLDGAIPLLVIEADGTVLLEVADGQGTIRGLVETEADAVRSWFGGTFETYHREADPVDFEGLTP